MPSPLSFIKLRDAEYVDQFAGSVVPELKDAQKVLNERYDLAEENDSKRAAIAREMMQNVAKKDEGQARLAYQKAMDDIDANKARGDYENMYGKTANSARQFSVNAAKFIGEKKRIDNYLDQLNKREGISNSEKAYLQKMALSKQNALAFDPENNIVLGDGFKEDAFADDYNFSQRVDEGFGKGFIPDIIGGAGSQFTVDKKTGLPLLIDSKGVTKEVKDTDIESAVAKYLSDDPGAQGHIDREARKIAFQAGYEDWRNLPEDIYKQAHQQAAYNLTNNAIKAAGIKYGFKQTERDSNSKMLNDAYLKGMGAGPKPPRETNMPQTYNDQTWKMKDNPKSYEDVQKTFQAGLGRLENSIDNLSFVDPVTKELSFGSDLRQRFSDFAQKNPEIHNPYADIQYQLIRKAAMEGTPKSTKKISIDDMIATKNPDFGGLNEIKLKMEGSSDQDIYNTWKDFKEKSIALQRKSVGLKPTLRDSFSDYVLGAKIEEDGKKARTGAMFLEQPIYVYKEGEKEPKYYDNGRQAVTKEDITLNDLSNFQIEEQSGDFKNTEGSYIAKGIMGGKPVKIYIKPTDPQRNYLKPLQEIEKGFDTGEKQIVPVTINGVQYIAEVDPFANLSIDAKNKKTSDFDPVVFLKDTQGNLVSNPVLYSEFKATHMLNNPYLDVTQSEKTTNTNFEVIK